jgi:hypothetical protein
MPARLWSVFFRAADSITESITRAGAFRRADLRRHIWSRPLGPSPKAEIAPGSTGHQADGYNFME